MVSLEVKAPPSWQPVFPEALALGRYYDAVSMSDRDKPILSFHAQRLDDQVSETQGIEDITGIDSPPALSPEKAGPNSTLLRLVNNGQFAQAADFISENSAGPLNEKGYFDSGLHAHMVMYAVKQMTDAELDGLASSVVQCIGISLPVEMLEALPYGLADLPSHSVDTGVIPDLTLVMTPTTMDQIQDVIKGLIASWQSRMTNWEVLERDHLERARSVGAPEIGPLPQ